MFKKARQSIFAQTIDGGQDCLSLPASFFDSSKLIPLQPRNSSRRSGLRQSRLWPLHFIKNCYRKISKVAQDNPAHRFLIVLLTLYTLHITLYTSATAAEAPRRIVSLAPSMTEILFSLGLGENIVGVTSYCDYPEEAKKKPKIGGMSNPSLEAVVSLRPDIVMMTTDGNPKEFEERLRSLKIKTYVFRARTLAGLPGGIREMGTFIGKKEKAEALAAEIENAINKFKIQNFRLGPHSGGFAEENESPEVTKFKMRKKKVLFIVWPEPLIVAGPGTAIDDAINLLGHENIAAKAKTTYPKYSMEEVIRQSPDVIFIGRQMGQDISEVSSGLLKRISRVPAVKNSRVFYVSDSLYRLGPRVVRGIEELAECLK